MSTAAMTFDGTERKVVSMQPVVLSPNIETTCGLNHQDHPGYFSRGQETNCDELVAAQPLDSL